jgi:hypothetical protein
MEVREGQRSSTIAMAVAHNCSTSDRDLDMYEVLLAKRGEHECLAHVRAAHQHINEAYRELLAAYAHEVSAVVPHRDSNEPAGNERSVEDIADADARRARTYETR